MKPNPFTLFLAMALFANPVELAASDDLSQIETPINSFIKFTPKPYKQNNPHRPKAPSAQQIFCYYEDGSLTFDFVIPEGDCSVTVTNLSNNHVAAYSISSEDEAVIYVGELSHAYIEVYTATGHEYEGYLE